MYKTHGGNIVSTMGFRFKDKSIIYGFGGLLCCVIMVCYPEVTVNAGKEALILWFQSLVPALLPFFIISGFVKRTGIIEKMPVDLYPFAMAVLSGYPVGASVAADYYRDGYIDEIRLRQILSYSMVTGPVFMIGTVGTDFLGDSKTGYILALSHYGAALMNGLFYCGKRDNRKLMIQTHKIRHQDAEGFEALTDSILDSFRSIGIILAYIMMFLIFTDFLEIWGLFSLMESQPWRGFLKGLLEMTLGCSQVAAGQTGYLLKVTLISFLISFGGLSVAGQSLSMLRGCPVDFSALLQMKLSHGVISAILSFILVCFVV